MGVTHWKLSELPTSEAGILQQIYGSQADGNRGYSPNKIEYVRELTPAERRSFGSRVVLSAMGNVRQVLYKIQGNLLPLHFNRAVHAWTERAAALRTNYCPVGKRFLAVVLAARRELPEIIYRNLEGMEAEELDTTLKKLMEADMRQGFDLRYGHLWRFSVFHTGPSEYAVIVTAVQAVTEIFDVRDIFRQAMGIKTESDQATKGEGRLQGQMAEMEAPIRQYWSRMLADLPPMAQLPCCETEDMGLPPGRMQETYLTYIPGHILSDLRERARSNKMMLMSILETAWGILLQETNDCRDVAFCLVVPSRQKNSADTYSLVPTRLAVTGTPTVQDVAAKSFQQFVVSQPYASLGREGIQELIGQQGERFDHFLNFYDFFVAGGSYSAVQGEPEGRVVCQNAWDVRDMRLGLGFRAEEYQVAVSFVYDRAYFSLQGIQVLVQRYLLVLQQMMTDWNLGYEAFNLRLKEHWERDAKAIEPENTRRILQDALSKLALLQECEEGVIQLFVDSGKISLRFEGDRITGKDVEEGLVFVVKGKVARCLEAGDGWYNAMDIVRDGGWLNENVFLPDRKLHISGEVLTEQAVVLTIPLQAVQPVMRKSPIFVKNILQYVLRQMEKYQRLWLQS